MSLPRLAPFVLCITVVLALGVTAILAVEHLNGTPYEISFGETLRAIKVLVPATALPALKLWLVWLIGTGIIAGIILRFDPEVGLLDSLLGGAAGVWAASYVLGQTLGPFGWFNPLVLRMLLFGGIIWLLFRQPLIAPPKMSGGQKLTLLAFALLAFGLLPLQLGSPVAPYMDVLTYPAAVQRILTFHVYLPFDNDAFGCWGARAQTPALELFYTALALAGGVKLGVLAHSQTMVPMAGLIIFTTYRLGLTMADDIAGGGAALFLFFTTEFRRLTGMRGTAVAFALVALGLAFLFERERRPVRLAIGGLMLGLAIPSHAIDGGLAMVVATFGAILYWINSQRRLFLITVLILFGASLFALPGVAIGLDWQLPYWVRICAMLAGAGIIAGAAHRTSGDEKYTFSALGIIQKTLVISTLGLGIYLQGFPNGTVATLVSEYPLLSLFAFGGLIIGLVSPASIGISMLVFAVMLEPAYEVMTHVAANWGGEVFQSGFGDIGVKLQDYWCPYFFAMLAGIPLAQLWRARRYYAAGLVAALLILLIYPWDERFSENYNYVEHSIAEEWGIDYGLAMRGFWVTTEDSRWAEGPDGMALIDFMRSEIARGRITSTTHVLHLTHDITVLGTMNRYAVFTGIDDDPVVESVLPMDRGWIAGSRVRRREDLPALLANRPQYVLDQIGAITVPPNGYEQAFARGNLRLYRRVN